MKEFFSLILKKAKCYFQSIQKKLSSTKDKDDSVNLKGENRLLKFNEVLSNKTVMRGICIAISLILFTFFNMAIQTFANLGKVIQGTFRTADLFVIDIGRFGVLYLIILVGIATFVGYTYYKIKVNFEDLNVGQKGTSRFMTLKEIQETYKEIADKEVPFKGIGGLPMSRYGDRLYIDDRINNNFIIALTRGGKGELYVIPSIDIYSRAEIQTSLIVNDLKNGELSRACIPHLIKRGYDVRILDFIRSDHSNSFNLLQTATDYYEAGNIPLCQQSCRKIAFSLYEDATVKDRFWVDAPIALFSAVAMAHIIDCCASGEKEKINIYSVTIFISTLAGLKNPKTQENLLDSFFRARSVHDPARLLYTTIQFSEGKTRASVLSIAFSKLNIFTYQNIVEITSTSDFNVEDIGFGDKPVALFIRLPQNNAVYYPIASIIFSQIHFILTNKADAETMGKCPRPVKFIGDEIFNGAPLENLDTILAMCLSANISYDFYAQSYDQVKAVYGDKSNIILNNCSTKIYIMSDDKDTREEFSEKLGPKTIKNVSRMGQRLSIDKSITENYEEKRLLTPAELTDLKEGETVVLQTLKRQALDGSPIVSRPILNSGETQLIYRYKYLPEFDPNAPLDYSSLNLPPKHIDIEKIVYLPSNKMKKTAEKTSPPEKNAAQNSPTMQSIPQQKLKIIENKLLSYQINIDLEQYTIADFEELLLNLKNGAQITQTDYTLLLNQIKTERT